MVSEDANQLVKRRDLIHITILLAIALGIGVYLIATTVLIAKDGVFYIRQAQSISNNPTAVIRHHPFGYPFLIFVAHKFVAFFTNSSSVYVWIYPAQGATLLCRLLALIPLYFIGKLLVGGKKSFWAILILVMLPYPARFGSGVLRVWPYILFLAAGFLFLLWGAEQGKWWLFGAAGLAAGIGHIIRPECAQLVIYGGLWLLIRLFLPRRGMSRPKLVCALFILLIGFAIPVAPYIKARGQVLPPKVKALIGSSCRLRPEGIQEPIFDNRSQVYTAGYSPGNMAKAIGGLIEETSGNLMYFFMPALLAGIYFRFRRQSIAPEAEGFFVPAFIVLNVILQVLLHLNYGHISRRHSLPLVVLTIFYVPIGLQLLADWLKNTFFKGRLETYQSRRFFILLAIGVAICLPKLFRPIRIEKRAYLAAAEWLKDNTAQGDYIAVFDPRISFYAERPSGDPNSREVIYVVRRFEGEGEEKQEQENWQAVRSLDLRKKSKLVIYKKVM